MSLPNIDAPQSDDRSRNVPNVPCGFVRSGDVLTHHFPDLVVSKQKLRRTDAIACVRLRRQEANQNLGFASRPFVLCGLPVRRPHAGQFLHERRNGHFLLQVTGHPSYGLPWGKTGSSLSSSRHLRFGSRAESFAFAVRPRCWTPSGCNRPARSIGA